MNVFRLLLVVAMLVLLPGCVSKPVAVEEPISPPLMIAQNGDGDVTIEWESKPGCLYTLYYQAAADSDWKVLGKTYRVRGTGETLTTRDRVNPNRPMRRYRIITEK